VPRLDLNSGGLASVVEAHRPTKFEKLEFSQENEDDQGKAVSDHKVGSMSKPKRPLRLV
jgi:hypothetical protein